MKRIVGVRFKEAGRMYYFNPGDLDIQATDGVIVETSRGMEYGEIVLTPHELPDEQIIAPLKDVLRIATEEDRETHARNLQLESEAFEICQQKIMDHTLDMKLVDVEYTFNGSKITFFFTSEGRVDFRDLVKDLAYIFKTRIELRQIGVRDEAKMLGGLGSCGRPICCKTFLADFQPVSIKMAKEQKLSLSPTKISGLCGRLMCCLKYEQDCYESMRKQMPAVNREVITADGKGTVLDNNVITERTKVRLMLPDGTFDVREYHFSHVRKPGLPEEEAAQRKELMAQKKARDIQSLPREEEFRFVTDNDPGIRLPDTTEAETRQDTPRKLPNKRKPRPSSSISQSPGNGQIHAAQHNVNGSNTAANTKSRADKHPGGESQQKPPRPQGTNPRGTRPQGMGPQGADSQGIAPKASQDGQKPARNRHSGGNRRRKQGSGGAPPKRAE